MKDELDDDPLVAVAMVDIAGLLDIEIYDDELRKLAKKAVQAYYDDDTRAACWEEAIFSVVPDDEDESIMIPPSQDEQAQTGGVKQ
jgi:hypothetical protein